jgi:AcrR family transcriptional regulator
MSIKASPRSECEQAETSVALLEPQGERRRRQLVEVTARLIADEGVEAVGIPRVAQLAGVGRTAIYRYFARREDLLAAVQQDFDERLRERIDEDEFTRGLLALGEPEAASLPPATRHLFEAIWDLLVERAPAGLILRAQAMLDEPESAANEASARFGSPLMALGLSELQATLLGDSANAILTRLYFRARRGEIDRDEAMRIGYRALVSLVRAFREA